MRRPLRAVSVAGLAFAGVMGGHAVAYWLTVPDAHHRSTLYAETGHGYLPSASWIAIVLGLSALAAGIAHGFVARTPSRRARFGCAALSMVGLQTGAFVLVEIFERLAGGSGLGTLSLTLLVVGVLVQAIAACLAALLLVGLRKLGSAFRGSRRASVAARRSATPSRVDSPAPRAIGYGAHSVRGPPLPHAA